MTKKCHELLKYRVYEKSLDFIFVEIENTIKYQNINISRD